MTAEREAASGDFPGTLARPARRALANAGISRLEQLKGMTETELLELHGMGPNAIRKLREALRERGWSFADA